MFRDEYTFEPYFLENLIVGSGNMRWYSQILVEPYLQIPWVEKSGTSGLVYILVSIKIVDNKLNINLAFASR